MTRRAPVAGQKAQQLAVAARGQEWSGRFGALPSSLQQAFVTVDGVPYAVVQIPIGGFAPISLTKTERMTLPGLLAGMSNRELAAQRGVSERTVANQLAAIYRKLGVNSRAELIALASRMDKA